MTIASAILDHIDFRVRDLAASRRFYEAALAPLGIVVLEEKDGRVAFGLPRADDFSIIQSDQPTRNVHLAFAARDSEAVDRFYERALAAGGRDNGAPGIRPQYSPGYYAAFVLDPEGNNVEAVFHGGNIAAAG
jgi:catechol 2,3-dioxygenase-like lactoylglutathione lyase family enzyme